MSYLIIINSCFQFRHFTSSIGWNKSHKVWYGYRCSTALLPQNRRDTKQSATFARPTLSKASDTDVSSVSTSICAKSVSLPERAGSIRIIKWHTQCKSTAQLPHPVKTWKTLRSCWRTNLSQKSILRSTQGLATSQLDNLSWIPAYWTTI